LNSMVQYPFNVHHALVNHDRKPVRRSSRSKRAGVGIEAGIPGFLIGHISPRLSREIC
ncbi:hypothetical protein IscW_ISCW009034, partial [Ixodes scapularis]